MIWLSDEQWERIRDHFPEEHIADGHPGRKPIPTRRVLEAVLWILNTGAQWHMLPQSYPNYKTVHRRFQTWCMKPNPRPLLATAPMIVIHSMMTYAKTASRWSRRTAPIAASARRKMDADFGDMPGAGWSNGSSPGFNGSAASLSAGSFIRRTSLASCNSLASSSSSNDFEIGSNPLSRSWN